MKATDAKLCVAFYIYTLIITQLLEQFKQMCLSG